MPSAFSWDPAAAFWEKTRRSPTGCILWQGKVHNSGYGVVHRDGRDWLTHRYAWFLTHGQPIFYVLHKCVATRLCVNPEHLYDGTALDNGADARHQGRTAKGARNGSHTHPERRPVGERQGHSKLTEDDVRAIAKLADDGRHTYRTIGALYGVTVSAVYGIAHRKRWQHLWRDTPSK